MIGNLKGFNLGEFVLFFSKTHFFSLYLNLYSILMFDLFLFSVDYASSVIFFVLLFPAVYELPNPFANSTEASVFLKIFRVCREIVSLSAAVLKLHSDLLSLPNTKLINIFPVIRKKY